jgi:hypothetical protein
MDYYKQIKIHGLTANTRLTLIDAANKHKGFMIQGADVDLKLEFVSGGTFSQGITVGGGGDPTSGGLYNAVVPIRLAAVTPAASLSAGAKIVLFN